MPCQHLWYFFMFMVAPSKTHVAGEWTFLTIFNFFWIMSWKRVLWWSTACHQSQFIRIIMKNAHIIHKWLYYENVMLGLLIFEILFSQLFILRLLVLKGKSLSIFSPVESSYFLLAETYIFSFSYQYKKNPLIRSRWNFTLNNSVKHIYLNYSKKKKIQ